MHMHAAIIEWLLKHWIETKLTRAGSLSTGTNNVALQWENAGHTVTASGEEHLPEAAGPGSTLPSSTP